MKKILTIQLCLLLMVCMELHAQTFYVDAVAGNDRNPGTRYNAPFKSLEKAVQHVNSLTGEGEIVIKLLPGVYGLNDKLDINPIRILSDTARYIIAAAIMPDEEEWTPEKMPVIHSVSGNNSFTQFPHSTGFLIASHHVTLQGLKFLGNPNPAVAYYYPISKENKSLRDLIISQCIFSGDKEASKIQGGVWAHGPQNTISHCVFYGCRNAVLFFDNTEGFTIEHSIVYGAYESAFWLGREDYSFTFTNNIIANNANFLVKPKGLIYASQFSNSILTNNSGFVGYWSREDQQVMPLANPNIQLDTIRTSGGISLLLNAGVKLERRHLHLMKDSIGADLQAGIFLKNQALGMGKE